MVTWLREGGCTRRGLVVKVALERQCQCLFLCLYVGDVLMRDVVWVVYLHSRHCADIDDIDDIDDIVFCYPDNVVMMNLHRLI